jgi:hypothetical protein
VKTGTDGIKAVDYSKLTALLIEASKTHHREIAALQFENAHLKKENEVSRLISAKTIRALRFANS